MFRRARLSRCQLAAPCPPHKLGRIAGRRITNTDIKDKQPLIDARKSIEKDMERFKAAEREAKTMGRAGMPKAVDPKERAREEAREWVNNAVETLQSKVRRPHGRTRAQQPVHACRGACTSVCQAHIACGLCGRGPQRSPPGVPAPPGCGSLDSQQPRWSKGTPQQHVQVGKAVSTSRRPWHRVGWGARTGNARPTLDISATPGPAPGRPHPPTLPTCRWRWGPLWRHAGTCRTRTCAASPWFPQVEEVEYEMEELQGNVKKKQKPPPRLTELEVLASRHKDHISRLEKVLQEQGGFAP